MAELNEDVGLIMLRRDRQFPAQWHLILHIRGVGEFERTYTDHGKALNAIASHMDKEVETGSNWLKR